MTRSLPSLFVGASCRNVSPVESNDSVFAYLYLWGQAVEMFHLWKAMTRSLPSLFLGASCRIVSPVESNDYLCLLYLLGQAVEMFHLWKAMTRSLLISICGGKL